MAPLQGKTAVSAACATAERFGLEILGSNAAPGKEFLWVNGNGDVEALRSAKAELESMGWHALPQDDAAEGYFMDFSLHLRRGAKTEVPSSTVVDMPDLPTESGEHFYYLGPSSLFAGHTFYAFAVAGFIMIVRHAPQQKFIYAGVAFFIIIALLLLCDWITVESDHQRLMVRTTAWREPRYLGYDNIETIRAYRDKSERLAIGGNQPYIGFTLKRGKGFDLFLPQKFQPQFVAFVRKNIGSPPAP